MTQVAKRNAETPVQAEATFIDMIERAARDPSIDIDKLERLLAMKERSEQRRAEQEFAEAMSLAQAEMRPVAADANNPQTKSRYASYMALDRAMRPIYTKYGFALSFTTGETPAEGHVLVACDVSHRSGHSRRYSVPMPADGKGAKGGDVMTKTHAVGAAMTYGQRYLLKMIFNVAVGEDHDGNDRGGAITDQQAVRLQQLIVSAGADIGRFLKWVGAESISDIPARKFNAAVAMLEAKKAKS